MAAATLVEKEAFSERLRTALARGRKPIGTPTALANAFNLKWHGPSVTVQAAQKWLAGTAMPAPDKIEVLAKMTGVPLQWLRYGIPVQRPAADTGAGETRAGAFAELDKAAVTAEELRLLARLRGMTENRRELVRRLVGELAADTEMWVK
jgi:hypothetical protein